MGRTNSTYGDAHKLMVGRSEEKIPLWRPRLKWRDTIKMDLQEMGRKAWAGLVWLRKGTDNVCFGMGYATFGFHKTRGISRLTY